MLSKQEVRGYLLAAKGGGMVQVFALLNGIPEVYRFMAVRWLCWAMIGVGFVLAMTGLWMAATHEKSQG